MFFALVIVVVDVVVDDVAALVVAVVVVFASERQKQKRRNAEIQKSRKVEKQKIRKVEKKKANTVSFQPINSMMIHWTPSRVREKNISLFQCSDSERIPRGFDMFHHLDLGIWNFKPQTTENFSQKNRYLSVSTR